MAQPTNKRLVTEAAVAGHVAANLPDRLSEAALGTMFVSMVMASGPGIDPSGVTPSAVALQTKINAIRDDVRLNGLRAKHVLGIPGGEYQIEQTLTLPPYVKVFLLGNVSFKWTGTTGPAMHITPLVDDAVPVIPGLAKRQEHSSDLIAGVGTLTIRHATFANAAYQPGVGLELGSRTDMGAGRPLCGYRLSHVSVQGFTTGIKLNVFNHYIATYDHIRIEQNETAVAYGDGTTVGNSGENFIFNDSIFSTATTGFRLQAPGLGLTLNSCSGDYIHGRMFDVINGYCHIRVNNGHYESINDSRDASGGFLVSTEATGNVNLEFNNPTFWIKSQSLIKGTKVKVTGQWLDQSVNDDTAYTVYPQSVRCEDRVNATHLRSTMESSQRIISRNNNRIADPRWTKETAGAVTVLSDWTVSQSGVTMAVEATSPDAGGKSLVLTMAPGSYILAEYKYDIPVSDPSALKQSAAFKTSAVGVNGSASLQLKDAAGVVTTTGNYTFEAITTLPANVWNLPTYLCDAAALAPDAAYRAVSVRPVYQFSNPTGAPLTVTIPYLYMGR